MTEQHVPPAPPPRRNRRKFATIGAGAATVVALVGGGLAYGITKLSGGGAQPHDVLPASMQAYVRLDLDPSASQKIAALKLIRRFPDAAKSLGIKDADQDLRKLVFDQLISEECPGVDYQDDVEPWLGERLGLGAELKDKEFLIAVQVTDESKSRAGIKSLFKCAGEDAYGIGFLDGYAVLSEKQATVDDAIKEARTSPLGKKAAFVDDFETLGEQGVASAWIDFDALADMPALKDAAGADTALLSEAKSMASTLRVDGSAVELAAVTGLTKSAQGKRATIGRLPADTVVGLSVGGGGEQVRKQYDTLLKQFTGSFGASPPPATSSSSALDPTVTAGMTPEQIQAYEKYLEDYPSETPTPEDFVAELEKSTGLKLPADLETLFGDSLTVAIGPKNLEKLPTLTGPADIASLDAGAALTSDPDKALDLVKRLADLAGRSGVELVATGTDDGAILATNQDAADALSGDGHLGDTKLFTSVMPLGNGTVNGLFVNVNAILDTLSAADPPDDVARDIKDARALEGFGMSFGEKDGHSAFSIRAKLKD